MHTAKIIDFAKKVDNIELTKCLPNLIKLLNLVENNSANIIWDKVNPIDIKDIPIVPLNLNTTVLSKLAVICLTGGLGTTMNLDQPKGLIIVKDGLSFLDIKVNQIVYINNIYNVNIPLILMVSFHTRVAILEEIKKYSSLNITIYTFEQGKFPRLNESILPLEPLSDNRNWCPPGTGDVYSCFYKSSSFDILRNKGYEYLFINNIDNLGATIDINIVNFISHYNFVIELTPKTELDVKGGIYVNYEGSPRLIELAQCPKENVDEFTGIKRFSIFNTNNIWCSFNTVAKIAEDDMQAKSDIIINKKIINENNIIQLEQSCGSIIRFIQNSTPILVNRSRFMPVKSNTDLQRLQTNLYSIDLKYCMIEN